MRILIVAFLSILIIGCESTPQKRDITSAADQQAIALFQKGDFSSAAVEYLNLSANFPDDSVRFQLMAVYAYIKANDYGNASRILSSVSVPNKNSLYSVLKAKIELETGKPKLALTSTDNIVSEILSPDLIRLLHETRAKAYESLGQYYFAAKELIILDNFLMDAGLDARYKYIIWNNLIKENIDEQINAEDKLENYLIAWIELAKITRSLATQKNEFIEALNVWSQLNPSHPANTDLISRLINLSNHIDSRPGQIALLLPLTGIYEKYSQKIRDGFLTAWFNEESYRPIIKIYNTESDDILDVYNRAVSEGANFIVGPLDKNAVGKLAELDTLPVRTLALNQIEQSINHHRSEEVVPLHQLVQFGLPPEDEARQVAQRGIFEGYNRALVVTSNDEFGTRVFNAFQNEWTEMGGNIIEKVEYFPGTADFVTPIKQLLNIDSSEQRFQNLRQKLGRNLLFNNRLRADAEFIFVVASNLTARQIVPHLRFFRAEEIPIFTTSSVFTGNTNPQIDNDLNGVEFVDIPWLLEASERKNSLAIQIRQNWDSDINVFPRYYAFGVDAFRLITRVSELMLKSSNKYQGETGRLYITNDGKVRRNLDWARFENGIPVLLSSDNTP